MSIPKITATYYEKNDRTITFFDGHALKESECQIAFNLAKKLNQSEIITKVYPTHGKPYTHVEKTT